MKTAPFLVGIAALYVGLLTGESRAQLFPGGWGNSAQGRTQNNAWFRTVPQYRYDPQREKNVPNGFRIEPNLPAIIRGLEAQAGSTSSDPHYIGRQYPHDRRPNYVQLPEDSTQPIKNALPTVPHRNAPPTPEEIESAHSTAIDRNPQIQSFRGGKAKDEDFEVVDVDFGPVEDTPPSKPEPTEKLFDDPEPEALEDPGDRDIVAEYDAESRPDPPQKTEVAQPQQTQTPTKDPAVTPSQPDPFPRPTVTTPQPQTTPTQTTEPRTPNTTSQPKTQQATSGPTGTNAQSGSQFGKIKDNSQSNSAAAAQQQAAAAQQAQAAAQAAREKIQADYNASLQRVRDAKSAKAKENRGTGRLPNLPQSPSVNSGNYGQSSQPGRSQGSSTNSTKQKTSKAVASSENSARQVNELPSPKGSKQVLPAKNKPADDESVINKVAKKIAADKAEDKALKWASQEIHPGVGPGVKATKKLQSVLAKNQQKRAEPTLDGNPDASLVADLSDPLGSNTSGPTRTESQNLASQGYTTWQSPEGEWFKVKDPQYVPQTPYTVLYHPNLDQPNSKGGWKIQTQSGNAPAQKSSSNATVDTAVEGVKEVAQEVVSRVHPGVGPAFSVVGELQDVLANAQQKRAKPVLNANPGSSLVVDMRHASDLKADNLGPTTITSHLKASEGYTVWKSPEGEWFKMKDPNYQPKSPYTTLHRPDLSRPNGNGGWMVNTESK